MFGYVVINQAELKYKDYDMYHSYYCGLCKSLRDNYGRSGQMTLSYDMTFLVILLTGLYEPESQESTMTCMTHPLQKHPARTNQFSEYAADMNLLLTYYKNVDDWIDEGSRSKLAAANLLRNKAAAVRKQYPHKAAVIKKDLHTLRELEKANEQNIDRMSGLFGDLMAEIFAYQHDAWEPSLRKIGFFLGKFVYLMDAYEDVEDDVKKGLYNPLAAGYTALSPEEFADKCKEVLTMMLAECSREFEKLPILLHADILRNILYSGVWGRFNDITAKRVSGESNVETGDQKHE